FFPILDDLVGLIAQVDTGIVATSDRGSTRGNVLPGFDGGGLIQPSGIITEASPGPASHHRPKPRLAPPGPGNRKQEGSETMRKRIIQASLAAAAAGAT